MGHWTARFATYLSVLFLLLPTIAAAGDDGPHMSILTFTAPTAAMVGQRISTGWSVSNTGNKPESVSGYDAVYLSFDEEVGCDDTLLGWWPQSEALAPSATYSATHLVNVMMTAPTCKMEGPSGYQAASPMDFGAKDVPAYLILQVHGGNGEVVTQARPIKLRSARQGTDGSGGA